MNSIPDCGGILYSSSTTRIIDHDWLKLDVQTPVLDTSIRNIHVGTSLGDRQLIVTFHTHLDVTGVVKSRC
ncbi:MAG: hypothetical protein O2856_16825 [Planctomycetota bacterium]|nr:hypothetical protein [Planctomycetota bacterium]